MGPGTHPDKIVCRIYMPYFPDWAAVSCKKFSNSHCLKSKLQLLRCQKVQKLPPKEIYTKTSNILGKASIRQYLRLLLVHCLVLKDIS